MDIKDIKALIKLVTETDITEFEMENADEKSSSNVVPAKRSSKFPHHR